MSKNRFDIRQRLASFRFAWQGIKHLVHAEHNARIHLAVTLVVVPMGFILRIAIIEWMLLLFAVGLVWVAELFNTSIERLCDHMEPNHNVKIGQSKDLAAGAVLVASMLAVGIGLLIFGPKILSLI